MSTTQARPHRCLHADRFFIGGEWVAPSSDATIDVIDSRTEELYYTIAEAAPDDMSRAVAAARHAFDEGPWPRLTHAERAEYIRALGAGLEERNDVLAQLWPRESGVLFKTSQYAGHDRLGCPRRRTPRWPTRSRSRRSARRRSGGEFGLLVREPVGVVGAIIPWNAPMALICHKIGPALLAGCTVVLKSSPEAPGEGYVFAEVAEQIGLPPGVLNVVTADREVSELLVREPRRRQDHVHRFDRGRPSHRVAVRRAHRALHARARREVGRRHPRRHGPRRPRPRRSPAPSAALNGPGVLVADADRRDEEPPRRARRRARRRRSARFGSAIRSTRSRRSARWSRNASATGSRATSPRASTRARRSRPAAVARRTSTAASTWSRPSSATSTTPRRSVARRSSARCSA